MGDVEELCRRVIIINFGKIVFDGQLSSLVTKYAPYKKIKVLFKEYVDPKKVDILGKIDKFEYPLLILKVPNEKINSVSSNILKNFNVEDITIEDPEVEDVIAQVYTEKRK